MISSDYAFQTYHLIIPYRYQKSFDCYLLKSLSLQASLTHLLKFPFPAAFSICSKSSSSNRIFFIVLLVRSKFGFFFSCMVGTTSVNLSACGTYHMDSEFCNAQQCWSTKGRLTSPTIKGLRAAGFDTGQQVTVKVMKGCIVLVAYNEQEQRLQDDYKRTKAKLTEIEDALAAIQTQLPGKHLAKSNTNHLA